MPRIGDIDTSSGDYRDGWNDGRKDAGMGGVDAKAHYNPPLLFGRDDYKAGYSGATGYMVSTLGVSQSMNRGLDVLGAESGGLPSLLFQTGGGVIDYVKQNQAEGAATAKANIALQNALAADKVATNAVAQAKASAALADKVPSKAGAAKADKMAADTALAAQDKAGAAVPEDKQADRVKAAQDAVDAAQTGVEAALRSGSAPQQLTAQARLDAANQTLTKAQGGTVDSGGGKGSKGGGGGSFFSRAVVGPVKVWHGLVALVVGVGGTIAYKKMSK